MTSSWIETSQKGTFSRPIGENETFIRLMSDAGLPLNRDNWAINSSVLIQPVGALASGTSLEPLFRRAWAHLRFQHPSIAAILSPDDNSGAIYTVPPDAAAVTTWVDETFSVTPDDIASAADLIPTIERTPHTKLIWIPRSSELLVHTSHWRFDGIGTLFLLNAFLELVSSTEHLADPASLAWGTEVARLAPTVEEAAAMPKQSTPEFKERGASYVAIFGHIVGALGVPYRGDVTTLPAGTRNALLTLDPETTSKVVAACKARGVTVTSAIHASVAGANYALADPPARSKHYTSTVRFNLRPYLPQSYSTPACATGLYTTGWMKRVNAHSSWDERVRDYNSAYHAVAIDQEYLDAQREYAMQLGELIRNMPPGDDPPSDIDFCSIGIAEKFIKRSYGTPEAGVEVRSVSIGIELLSRQGVTYVWTFRDKLHLNLVYNEAFHSEDQMAEFVATVRSELLTGLGI